MMVWPCGRDYLDTIGNDKPGHKCEGFCSNGVECHPSSHHDIHEQLSSLVFLVLDIKVSQIRTKPVLGSLTSCTLAVL